MSFALIRSIGLALGGVGFPSPLFALRGRGVTGLGGGKACLGNAQASNASVDDVEASSVIVGNETASTAKIGDEPLEC